MSQLARVGTAALAVALLLLYLPVLGFDFLELDDGSYLTRNPHLGSGLSPSTFTWAFTSTYFGWWHPLTWLSHLLDVRLFGMTPGGHHLTSALLHAANAVLAMVAFRRLGLSEGRALVASALTFLHPTRVESVAWLSERKDLVFIFFGLVALILWLRFKEKPSAGRYVLAALAYACSLMGKTMLVTLPFLLLIIDVWLARGGKFDWKKALLEKVPLLALAIGAGLSTVYAQRAVGAIQPLEAMGLADRFSAVPVAYTHYLRTTFLPTELCAYYPRHALETWQWLSALGLCLTLAATLIALRRRVPFLGLGAAWFVVSLLPISGLAQAGGALAADRYLYWPQLGLFAGLVAALPEAFTVRPAAKLVAGLLAAGLALLTALQLPVWRDSETLFQATLEVEPENPFIQTSLGLLFLKQGKAQAALEPLRKAAPYYPYGQSILGLALIETGDFDGGRRTLDQALSRSPEDPGLKRNVELGRARLQSR